MVIGRSRPMAFMPRARRWEGVVTGERGARRARALPLAGESHGYCHGEAEAFGGAAALQEAMMPAERAVKRSKTLGL